MADRRRLIVAQLLLLVVALTEVGAAHMAAILLAGVAAMGLLAGAVMMWRRRPGQSSRPPLLSALPTQKASMGCGVAAAMSCRAVRCALSAGSATLRPKR